MVTMARMNPKLSRVCVFGHSEGALIALKMATTTPVDGVISAAGPGRPVIEVAREQLERQLSFDEMHEYDALAAALKANQPLEPKSPALKRVFQPQLEKFLRGLMLLDPKPLAAAFRGAFTVEQGDNDLQITVERDAKPLAAAHPGARLVVLKNVAHPLKRETERGQEQPSYRDPSLPIDLGVVSAILATVH
jgi:pimeloyl-ACP methyl ester carboxylesterase